MHLTLTPYQESALEQAIMESMLLWDDRIREAEAGTRPNLSIEGARLMIDDLREIQQQIKSNR
jgi:hypothetical protein